MRGTTNDDDRYIDDAIFVAETGGKCRSPRPDVQLKFYWREFRA